MHQHGEATDFHPVYLIIYATKINSVWWPRRQALLIVSQAGHQVGVQCFDHVRAPLIPLCFSPHARCQICRIREAAVHVHLPECHQQEIQAEVNVTAYYLIGFRPSLIFMFIAELGVFDESLVSHSNSAAFKYIQIILCYECQRMLLSPSDGTAPQDEPTPPPPPHHL